MLVNEVASPWTINEAVAFLKRQVQVVPVSAGTRLLIEPQPNPVPRTMLSLSGIKELQAVSRTDRFVEIGAGVSLNRILALPLTGSLDPLRKAILTVGTSSIRNRASLGGNIGATTSFGSCFSMLSCMDASLELRSATGSRWVHIQDLVSADGHPAIPAQTFITRFRLPIREWDHSCFVRRGDTLLPGDHNAALAALASVEKNALTDIRIVIAGSQLFRCRDMEMQLAGKRLPLSPKDVAASRHLFMEQAIEAGFIPSLAIGSAETVGAFLANLSGGLA